MYTFFKGIIDEVFFDGISLDVNGTGYFIFASKKFIEELNPGDNLKIYTTLIHKEDTMKLFGFKTKEEREMFNLLFSVSGIGPKTAIGILSVMDINDIVNSIYSNDVKKLSKAPGVGQKTAQRIILELREKITGLKSQVINTLMPETNNLNQEKLEETEAALFALGYNNNEIRNALKCCPNLKIYYLTRKI